MNTDAISIFNSAVNAVQPATLIQQCIQHDADSITICGQSFPRSAARPIWVFGAGKAAAAMAQAVETALPDCKLQGLVITKYGHELPLQHIRLATAGHPIPDENGVAATLLMIEMITGVQADDIVLFLLSGGTSALLADHPPGATLQEMQTVFDLLLKSGADIHEMNTVRKHLSGVKGGQLALLTNTQALCTIVLSDVVGDDLHVIGSGPTVPDPSTFADAMAVVEKYQLTDLLPLSIYLHLERGCAGSISETPKPGHPRFAHTYTFLAGTNRIALEAAANKATQLGYDTHILTSTLTGDAIAIAHSLANQAKAWTGKRPACLLAGGESTVTVTGKGLGGRNQQLALAAGIALNGQEGITFLSAGTDGTDGPTDAAGAIADATVMQVGKNAQEHLDQQNAYPFFQNAGGLLITGPTQTNVMDIIIILLV
ncbi:glycerate kinase type-2 family protein [Chitinophaga sancti]|uniref:glycerate kinase type-2 family protein n=1 Tax=Chitinophaga sancti TaxID=1004 RepID=UPI003F7A90EE